ncbi:hypothetical protein BJV82DRAFT_250519 [Fennellomyces sp. T-0311]|nr:hypothetical protein BJV82DRAFT_250519 [Fennellomyces sp. T-0311]
MENLTRINLDFDTNPMVLSLVDVLTACPHLTHLTYTIGSSLSLSAVDAYDTPTSKLTTLELRAPHIADTLIETVLDGSPDLQHLIVNGCGTSIFNIVAKHAPKLQVLGYNTYDEIMPQHRMVNEPGLRVLYTKITNGTGMPASILLPFLYRHMATLENICVHVASMKNEEVTEIPTKCPGFKLKNLRVLKLAAKKTTQRYLFQAIQHTGLEDFTISHVYDTSAMVDALKTLSLLHFSMGRIRSSNPNTRQLVSLFTDYAKKPMKSIDFCGSDAITDHVFQALGDVAALRHVAFSHLERSTAQGIDGFFAKAQQLESVRLVSISAVTNNTLTVLGACQPLRKLYLDKIPAVTNDGVARLKRANGCLWVRVSECPSIVTD